ncbi:MAG: phage major capsid protein [Christensenellaceae bacterium]|jgi:HK97 family phage major capsid protein|nr:phage major capsid protein [Christensenellaceae bacterium]
MATNKKNTTPAPADKKSMKMGADELSEMIKAAVKECMEGADSKSEEPGTEEPTEVSVMDIIEEAVAAATEKRKARKDAGEEVGEELTADEILAEASAIVDSLVEEDEQKSDEPDTENPEDGQKGAPTQKRQFKDRQSAPAKAAPARRKYSDIYIARSGAPTQRDEKKLPPEIQLARAVKCLDVFGRHDPEAAAFYAKKHYNDENMAREFKALNATTPSGGGYLIPEIYLDEIIEMLYSKTVIFELGARKVPMSNGNLNIPKMTSGARATWGGEQRKIAKSQPAFGNIKLSAKRLEAIVPQTRELLMSTNYSADAIFAQDLTRRMELGLDFGALFGIGGEFQPLGITKTSGIEVFDCNTITDTDLVDANDHITPDFPVYVVSKVMSKNVDDLALGWTFNSMMEGFLKNMKTTDGHYIYREEMNGGKLLGFPFKVSNQISTSAANKTEIIFGNWADLLIGEQLGLETYTTLDGSWTDEDGVQHNAFEENLTATRALMYVDIAARHAESFAHVKNAVIG